MAEKLSDILVVSDIDNTLLRADIGIPKRNIEAIKKFEEAGGNFTLATGRGIEGVMKQLENLTLCAPAVLLNGGLIYDTQKELVLKQHFLPKTAEKIVDLVLDFPGDVGITLYTDRGMYMLKSNYYTQRHVAPERLAYIQKPLHSIEGNWYKLLFCAAEKDIEALIHYLRKYSFERVDFVRTNVVYYEVVPQGISKAEGIFDLCSILGVDKAHTVAIGDYYNDVEMLREAGFSIVVDNAPDDIKSLADLVVSSVAEGGVAAALEYIMENYKDL